MSQPDKSCTEWRLVDEDGAPLVSGEGFWPIFTDIAEARAELEIAREAHQLDGGDEPFLQQREVWPWEPAKTGGEH